ncbi:MAG: D-glycero-beta-D-manno-heptose 1,7-bisphosphate 7-phosphatase [Campylobacter sp.]|nr:D-glycero-beta-D-manno-heptose 1,7-bisphosphate 7-phosphatase [Campylobacter sp.]
MSKILNATKALFLDRDGVINHDAGYVYNIKAFKFCDEIFDVLAEFYKLGYILIVVTNQSGIGRGYYTRQQFENLNDYMLNEFKKHGVSISKVYFCPHSPEDRCECRKPKPKMILDAAGEFNINLSKSIIIGDKSSDMEAGQNAGVGQGFLLDGVKFKSVKDVYKYMKKEKML